MVNIVANSHHISKARNTTSCESFDPAEKVLQANRYNSLKTHPYNLVLVDRISTFSMKTTVECTMVGTLAK